MTEAQKRDIELCKYFYPCNPTKEQVAEYLALSERGEGKKRGKLSDNPLVIGKTKRGLHMQLWEEGVLEGSVPYFTLLGGESKPIPRFVVDFMKKEMFKGTDADLIEKIYSSL